MRTSTATGTSAVSPWTVPSGTPVEVAGDAWARSQADRFAEALRPRVMGPRLSAAVGAGPETCHVLDAKYEPGVRATVLYAHGDNLLRGDLLAVAPRSANAVGGVPAVVAPGLRICSFPHDPDLGSLPRLMDATVLGPVLTAALAGQPDASSRRRAARCHVRLLRYRPGKRATVLVTFGAGAASYVAKAYHDPAKAAAVACEAPALAAGSDEWRVLRLAPTVAHVPELAMVVQRAVRGVPLDVLVGTGRGCDRRAANGVALAAAALAELHRSPRASTRQRPVDRELDRFGVRSARIATVDARFGAAAARLAERLVSVGTALPAGRTGLVHGDCKPSQFLLFGTHAYLLDLDHLGVSDQAVDAGTFLATLRQLATRHLLARRSAAGAEWLARLAGVFLDTYVDRSGADPSGARIRVRWQEAVALERKALRAFARAPASPLAGALVDVADRCLDELEGAL